MNLIDATLTGSIESAINAYLSTRPSARHTLGKLTGQSFRSYPVATSANDHPDFQR